MIVTNGRSRIFPTRRSLRDTLRTRLKRITVLVVLVRFLRALATPLGRGRLRAGRHGARLFQPATVTRMDRHPTLFAFVATRLAEQCAPRLLSFGCSTGEEAFTLAKAMPHATIDAIDANPACIVRAQKTQALGRATDRLHTRIRFACADRPNALTIEPYHAVFCLSVLRHGDLEAWRPERCTTLMPFARFAAAVEMLDACVRPGGLLVLWGCNFRFADTTIAAGYRSVAIPGAKPQQGPFYGADDRLLPDDACTAFVFVKQD